MKDIVLLFIINLLLLNVDHHYGTCVNNMHNANER